jgi:hypothetical protein
MESLSQGRLVVFLLGAMALRTSRVRVIHGYQRARVFVEDVVTETTPLLLQRIHVSTVRKNDGGPLQLPEDILMAHLIDIFLSRNSTSDTEEEDRPSDNP